MPEWVSIFCTVASVLEALLVNNLLSMKKNLLFIALSAAIVAAPYGAQALTYDIGGNAAASVSTPGINATVGGSVSGNANSSASSTGAGSSSASANGATTNATPSDNATLDATGSAGVTGSGSIIPIAIDRADVDDSTEVTTSAEVSVPSAVHTQADLSAYASSAVRADKNIDGVVLSDSGVMVRYMQPAKLFGFIPVSVTVTTEVDNQGHVAVKYPWYRFLVSVGDKDKLEADIQSRVDAALAARMEAESRNTSQSSLTGSAVATTTVMLDVEAKAELLANVREAMQASVEANADAYLSAPLR